MSDPLRFHPKRSTNEARLLGRAIREAIQCGLIQSCEEVHRESAQIVTIDARWVAPWDQVPSILSQLAFGQLSRRIVCSDALLDAMEDLAEVVPWWEVAA